MNHFFFTYVLLSKKDHLFYTGYTLDLHVRVSQHNAGQVPSTYYRRPFELIYFEGCRSKTDALNRERYLKSGMGKRYIRNRLKNFSMETSNGHFQHCLNPNKSRKLAKKRHL